MNRVFQILLMGILTLPPCRGYAQPSWMEIPLGIEQSPSGNDSFISYYQPERPKIALALSGGGARGLAQIGVLKVFEKHGILVDGIAGTSMGAIIGGLYAVGYTATEIETLARQIRWDELIQDTPPRKQLFLGQKEEKSRHILQLRLTGFSLDIRSAYTAGQKLTTLIADLLLRGPHPLSTDFDSLQIPFRAVATDLVTGQKVVLRRGSLVDALRASMAIPLLFTPVLVGEAMLVDGGLVQNLPVSEAKGLGADLIIAVDTSSKLRDPKALNAPWEIADQTTSIMQQERTLSQLLEADIGIQPDLHSISNIDFDLVDTIVRAGEEAAENAIPRIERFFTEDSDSLEGKNVYVKKILLSGCRELDPQSFLSTIAIDTSSSVSRTQIVWAGRSLLQTGYLRKVSAFVDTSSLCLKFEVEENPLVNKIEILGNTVFSDSVLLSGMESRPGSVPNIQKGRQDLRGLIQKYHDKGYALARISGIRIDHDTLKDSTVTLRDRDSMEQVRVQSANLPDVLKDFAQGKGMESLGNMVKR